MIRNLILTKLILLMLLTFSVGCTNTDSIVNTEEHKIEYATTEKTEVEETIIETTETTEEVVEETEETTEETEEEAEIIMYFSEEDVIALAKVLYNECRGIPSDMEKACVAWVACNRVDNGKYGSTIYKVVTAPNQFAYWSNTPVRDDLYDLALDVLTRWNNEKNGFENVGRVLPPDYLYFYGDGEHNHFRNAYSGDFDVWDYSLDNPHNS